MSVIDFISVRRRQDDALSEPGGAKAKAGTDQTRATAPAALSANQFARHISQIAEDEMRRSIKRHVDVIDPREMIDLAKMMAELKAKYIAMTLTTASNRTPMTDAEVEQLKSLRLRVQELEAAYNEVNEAIGAQLVEVRGVSRE
ncbi:MAG: hypothetical protein SFV19_06915 [Rhodospirillaceae bacterium]|nr:hypothetical protein [Rhodospirillaceae bacterium]